MLLVVTISLLLLSIILGYCFAGKQGAIGSFLTTLFLFGLPTILYMIQTN